jgi:hypothetical protein
MVKPSWEFRECFMSAHACATCSAVSMPGKTAPTGTTPALRHMIVGVDQGPPEVAWVRASLKRAAETEPSPESKQVREKSQ